jgi:hypothetical protein
VEELTGELKLRSWILITFSPFVRVRELWSIFCPTNF